jgi:hypothetical protein
MKPLPILWQRLVADGKTCDRCHATHQEMQPIPETLLSGQRWSLPLSG